MVPPLGGQEATGTILEGLSEIKYFQSLEPRAAGKRHMTQVPSPSFLRNKPGWGDVFTLLSSLVK